PLPAGCGNPEKRRPGSRRPGSAKNRDQAPNRAPAGGPRAGTEQAGGAIADTDAEVPSGARCRPRRLGPGNGGTQEPDGKGRGTGYRAPPGQTGRGPS